MTRPRLQLHLSTLLIVTLLAAVALQVDRPMTVMFQPLCVLVNSKAHAASRKMIR